MSSLQPLNLKCRAWTLARRAVANESAILSAYMSRCMLYTSKLFTPRERRADEQPRAQPPIRQQAQALAGYHTHLVRLVTEGGHGMFALFAEIIEADTSIVKLHTQCHDHTVRPPLELAADQVVVHTADRQ